MNVLQPELWELGMQGDGKTMHTVESLRRRAGLGMRKGG